MAEDMQFQLPLTPLETPMERGIRLANEAFANARPSDELPSAENRQLRATPHLEPIIEVEGNSKQFTREDVIAITNEIRVKSTGLTEEELAASGVVAARYALNAKKVQGKI